MWGYSKVSLRLTGWTLNKAGTFYPPYLSSLCSVVGRSPLCGSPLVRVSAVYCLFLSPSQYSIHSNQCGLFSFLLLKTVSFSAVAAGVSVLRNRQVVLLSQFFIFDIRTFCFRILSLLFLFLYPIRFSLIFSPLFLLLLHILPLPFLLYEQDNVAITI